MNHFYFIFFIVVFLFKSIELPAQKKQLEKSESISKGEVGNGSLINGKRLPYKGKNYKYFSPLSYHLLGRAHVNSRLYRTIQDAYTECERTCPGQKFRIMECSRKKGGKMKPHRTHQNGLSVDFMTPLIKKGKQYKRLDRTGIWHYLLKFDETGTLKRRKKVKADFEMIARHLLALDNSARKNGLKIDKVIFKIDMKGELFNTESGKELKSRGIYFAKALSDLIDNLHDDHYHVDFKVME
jgi:penicillin-insensitive murein DD-endopeptidase